MTPAEARAWAEGCIARQVLLFHRPTGVVGRPVHVGELTPENLFLHLEAGHRLVLRPEDFLEFGAEEAVIFARVQEAVGLAVQQVAKAVAAQIPLPTYRAIVAIVLRHQAAALDTRRESST